MFVECRKYSYYTKQFFEHNDLKLSLFFVSIYEKIYIYGYNSMSTILILEIHSGN